VILAIVLRNLLISVGQFATATLVSVRKVLHLPRHNDFRLDQLTSEETAGELTRSQSRIMPQHAPSRRAAMQQSRTLSVGLAVHTDARAVVSFGTSRTRQCDIDTLIQQLQSQSPPLVFV